jgi:hypothetical protein
MNLDEYFVGMINWLLMMGAGAAVGAVGALFVCALLI